VSKAAENLLQKAGIELELPDGNPDPGLIIAKTLGLESIEEFITTLGKPRDHSRETDPPMV
jgi:catalase